MEPFSSDTPEIRISTVLRTVREVPNEIPFTYVYPTPLKADTSLFRIADMRSCPNTYLRWVILRTAHHATQNVKRVESVSCLGSGSAHSLAPDPGLAPVPGLPMGGAWCAGVRVRTHKAKRPLKCGHLQWVPTVSGLEGFHCSTLATLVPRQW